MGDEKKSQPSTPANMDILDRLTRMNSRELSMAIKKMNPGQKKLLAFKGNAAIRKILSRDPNPDIQLAVVNSPKTIEGEIERLASFSSTTEIVLKAISANSRWMKSYRIKHCLAKNPKTSTGVANRCLKSLTTHDLKKISQDPNIKKPTAQAAQRMLKSRR